MADECPGHKLKLYDTLSYAARPTLLCSHAKTATHELDFLTDRSPRKGPVVIPEEMNTTLSARGKKYI